MDASENSSRPTMDQLEAESGLTWDEALSRLKDLEKTLKYQIQCDIREMKLCMTSNKIEDVSLKASRLHDIRRTLASSRALVREECAIMKEFEKIKGILGESRTMDEDDWSSTKNKTKYWGEQLANVRRRQRRISGDVVDLDSVVSEIMTRRDMENDSVDSLDNLSFHLTNYPLFNNAPYGHHLSVPSRPGSAMSDVSAVSTGIAGYFKGRDTTDMSQSETEQSVTPQMQKKKLFTKTSTKEASLDGSEFEEDKAGCSMQEMYLKEKRKSAMEFKKKALAERDANVKAIGDHETGATSEYEGYYDDEHDAPWDTKQHDEEEQQWQVVDKQELLMKKQEEEEMMEAQKLKEQEEKMMEAQKLKEEEERMMEALRLKEEQAENKRIQEENIKKQKEAQRLKEQVEERKRIEAEEKKKKLEENKKKLEEKKAKEEEKKKKLEEKKKKLDEKKRKEEIKKKKSEDKLKQDEEEKKEEEEAKMSEQQQKDKLIQEKEDSQKQTVKKMTKSRSQSREKKSEEENATNLLTKKAKDDTESKGKQDLKTMAAKSRSQSRDRKSDHVSEEEIFEDGEKATIKEQTQSTKVNDESKLKGKQDLKETKIAIKSRSQSREKKLDHVDEEETVDDVGQTQAKDTSKLKGKQDLKKTKTAAKSRSQSREKKSDHVDDEESEINQGQTQVKNEFNLKGKQDLKKTKIAAKSRSQSREKKSDHVDEEEIVDEESTTTQGQTKTANKAKDESKLKGKQDLKTTAAKSRSQSRDRKSDHVDRHEEVDEENAAIQSQSIKSKDDSKLKGKQDAKKMKTVAKSRSQSRENKSSQIGQEEVSIDSNQNYEKEGDVTNKHKSKLEEHQKTVKAKKEAKSRSQSRENKSDDIQSEEMMGGTSIKSSQKGQKVDDKVGKLSKTRSQSRESKPNELDNEGVQLESNKMEDDVSTQQMKPKRTKGAKTKTGTEVHIGDEAIESYEKEQEESEIGNAQPQIKPQRKKGLKVKSAEESKTMKSSEQALREIGASMDDEKSFMSQEEDLQGKKSVKSRSQSRDRKEVQNPFDQPLEEFEDEKSELKPQRTNRKSKSKQPDEKVKSRSVSRERKDQFYDEREDESQMAQTLDSEGVLTQEGKKKIISRSRSQSGENKHDHLEEEHDDGNLIKEVHEPVAKPKRSKNKQLAKQSSIANDDVSLSTYKTEEQLVQASIDQVNPDEMDSMDMSNNLDRGEKMTNQRSRSHSRDMRKLHAVETEDVEFPQSQSISSSKNDMAAEGVTKEVEDYSSQVVKPKRTKGKGKKQPEATENRPRSLSRERKSFNQSVNQTECFDESGPNGQFAEAFKQESPEYAEIDYEQDHILAKGEETQFQIGKSISSRSASKERKKMDPDYAQVNKMPGSDEIQEEAEPIYAKVQKKGSRDVSLSRDGAKSPKTASTDSKRAAAQDEPVYAEIEKKKTRSSSGDRRHGNNTKIGDEEGDSNLFPNAESGGKKKSQPSSRQASRERKEMTLQQDSYSDEGIPFEMDRQFPSSEQNDEDEFYDFAEDKDSSRKMFMDGKNEGENNEMGLDLSLTQDPDEDFWGSEDQMEVSSTGLPDIASVKKPARRTRKKSHEGRSNETLEKKEKPPRNTRKGLASDPALQKYLDQNKSLNLSDDYPFESQDTDESAEATKDFTIQQLKRSHMIKDDSLDYDEYEEANEYFADPHETGIGTEDIEKEREYLSAHKSSNLFRYSPSNQGQIESHEEIERPLSALGQYSGGEDTSPYPEDSDELISYRESGLVREKPDGMDRDELRQFDPSHFQPKRTRGKDIKRERLVGEEEYQGSSFEDEVYFQNFSQKPEEANAKIGTMEPLSKASINQVSSGRNTSRERPNNLDLKDIKHRVGDKQKGGFFKDEALIDEMDLQNSLGQMWKKPGRRRRTVSHTFESEVDEYDDEEFDSDAKNYSIPPLLQPPPRKNRSRSGSVSPLPKEKENIGPKLERMFSTDQDNNVLEFEYDDNGVKKIKKVSFATENEQFVLRPDPEVRSIPGTKLFSFSPSKTHEQPLDLRQRGRQKKKSAQKKRSSSADVFPTWSKNSALNFLKSMTNFTGSSAGRNQEEDMDLVDEQMGLDSYKFDEAFANASSLEKFFPDEKVIDHKFINNEPSKAQNSASLNEYLDKAINEAISPKKSSTTQSLDNVNLRNNYMDRNLPDRPCSTEPISAVGATYQNPDKKQSSIFGNIISRAKSLSRNNSRQNSEERSIFKNLFQPKSNSKSSSNGSRHKRSLSFDGFGRKISGGSSSTKGAGEPSIISTEENYNDGADTEFLTESESSFMNRLKMKKLPKTSVNKTDFDQLFARGLALSAEKEKEMMNQMEAQMTPHSPNMLDHRPTTPFEVFSKDEVFKKSQQGAGISFEEKVKYFLDDLSHQPHTSTFQAPMNCSPVAAAAAVAAMAPPRSTIAQGNKSRGGFIPKEQPPKPEPKESPHQFLRRAEEFVKLAEVDTEYSQPVWPAIVQSPDDLPPPKAANVNASPKSPMYPNFSKLAPAVNKAPPSPIPASENALKKPSIPAEVSQALAPMMAYMMEMKKSSKSPEFRSSGEKLKEFVGPNLLQRSASSSDPFPGSYKTDLGRAEYGTLTRKDSTNFKGRASSVSSRIPLRENSLDRVHKLRRSTSRDTEINHRRRSQEPLILDHTRCDSRMSNYSADVPDLEDADISNAMMLKSNLNSNIAGSKTSGNDHEFLSPSSSILQKKEKVLDEMAKEKLALQEAKSWFQTILMIILCICAIIFIQSERRT